MIFKCRITLADTKYLNILYFPDSMKIISIEELGLWCPEILVPVLNKTLIGQQFRPTLDLLCHEDFNVGLSFTSSNIEIFMAQ